MHVNAVVNKRAAKPIASNWCSLFIYYNNSVFLHSYPHNSDYCNFFVEIEQHIYIVISIIMSVAIVYAFYMFVSSLQKHSFSKCMPMHTH